MTDASSLSVKTRLPLRLPARSTDNMNHAYYYRCAKSKSVSAAFDRSVEVEINVLGAPSSANANFVAFSRTAFSEAMLAAKIARYDSG